MRLVFVPALLLLAAFSMAPAQAAKRPQDKVIANSQTFINQHPDLLYRLRGLEAYKKLRYSEAFTNFKRAAKYADKPSQGMMAEMLWKGEGVALDKIQAYAWMDIAAERAYPTMLLSREKMWSLLNEDERKQAIATGLELYKYYGDDVAKNRLAVVLRRARNNITGSHLGFVGYMTITIQTPSGQQTVDGSFYYQDKFWKPEQYFEWQDTAWKNPPTGNVNIGPLETNPDAKDKK
jgi:uncharacterized protein